MNRTKFTAVVLSTIMLFAMVSSVKSHTVFADEVEETIDEENITDEAEDAINDPGIRVDDINFPDEQFRSYVEESLDKDCDLYLNEDEIAAAKHIEVQGMGISTLSGIENFTSLEVLYCFDNHLTTLDLRACTSLRDLDCCRNGMTSLDISTCAALDTLTCCANSLTSLDVSKNTGLSYIDCSSNQLTSIDISNNQLLKGLVCYENQISALDISNNPNLSSLGCCNNPMSTLDIHTNPGLCMIYGLGEQDIELAFWPETAAYYCYRDNAGEYHMLVDRATTVVTTAEAATEVTEDHAVAEAPAVTAAAVDMYRLYNPNSGEHFFTASAGERDMLVAAGWSNEGIGWKAPVTSNTPVYRLYNQNGGEHHYTTSASERDFLVSNGWSDEGIGWYSDDAHGVPVYRQYNPNSFSNNHNYSTSASENDWLVSLGWKSEGIAWYGVA